MHGSILPLFKLLLCATALQQPTLATRSLLNLVILRNSYYRSARPQSNIRSGQAGQAKGLQTEPQDMIRADINLQVCIES